MKDVGKSKGCECGLRRLSKVYVEVMSEGSGCLEDVWTNGQVVGVQDRSAKAMQVEMCEATITPWAVYRCGKEEKCW